MNALREVREISADTVTITIPKSFHHRMVEVIVLPFESGPRKITSHRRNKGWPEDFFARTAGCFIDSPLEREPQGDYETRAELV